MDELLNSEFTKELKAVGLDKININLKDIEDITSLDGKNLSNITNQRLTAYVFSITQYQLYIQLHHNIRNVEYSRAKVAFEQALNKALVGIGGKNPVKEKTAVAMEDPELQRLQKEMLAAEARSTLFNKVPEAFTEVANSLKKELNLRD